MALDLPICKANTIPLSAVFWLTTFAAHLYRHCRTGSGRGDPPPNEPKSDRGSKTSKASATGNSAKLKRRRGKQQAQEQQRGPASAHDEVALDEQTLLADQSMGWTPLMRAVLIATLETTPHLLASFYCLHLTARANSTATGELTAAPGAAGTPTPTTM